MTFCHILSPNTEEIKYKKTFSGFFRLSSPLRLAYCFRFQQVSVVIITILRALVLSADEKPENNFYTRFYTDVSSFETSEF